MSIARESHDAAPKAPTAEEDAIPSRTIAVVAAITVVVVVAAVLVAYALLRHEAPRALSSPPRMAPDQIGIVEQTSIRDTERGLAERAEQTERLNHFGWVDHSHGIAMIPIDRAMDLVTDESFRRRAFPDTVSPDAGIHGER